MTNAAALTDLENLLQKRLSRSVSDRNLHGRSESHFSLMPPDAVAYVESTEEVQQLMQICAKHGCPVIGWGTGTSLEGHTSAPRGGVTVDFSRMSKVLQINPDDMDAVVQPGLTREALNLELRHSGLFFSVDPGANASIGGMAAARPGLERSTGDPVGDPGCESPTGIRPECPGKHQQCPAEDQTDQQHQARLLGRNRAPGLLYARPRYRCHRVERRPTGYPAPGPGGRNGYISVMEGSPFGMFGDPDELRARMQEMAEQMQSSQEVAWADNAIRLAVEMTVASLGRLDLTGSPDEQAMQAREAIRIVFPEAVTLVREARQGLR